MTCVFDACLPVNQLNRSVLWNSLNLRISASKKIYQNIWFVCCVVLCIQKVLKESLTNVFYWQYFFSLNTADAPSITLSTKKYNFTEGDDMHLECESDGRPPPTVTWLKRDGQNTIAYPSGEQLTIRNANRTETGVYTCSASNGIGKYATATRTVDVHCKYVFNVRCFV